MTSWRRAPVSAANLEGLSIGGKTGTASTGVARRLGTQRPDGQPLDDAWFVGFPESKPKSRSPSS